MAELDRANILERMWHGANRAARLGKWLGGIVLYGYIVNEDGFLEINNTQLSGFAMTEADVIKMVFSLCTKQHMSTIKICDYLNALGILPSYSLHGIKIVHGKRKVNTAGIWAPHQIGRMLKSTTYKGIYLARKAQLSEIVISRIENGHTTLSALIAFYCNNLQIVQDIFVFYSNLKKTRDTKMNSKKV